MIWSTRISETDLVFEISFYIRLKLFLLRSLSPLNLEIPKQHILPSLKNFITFTRQSSQHVEILGRSSFSKNRRGPPAQRLCDGEYENRPVLLRPGRHAKFWKDKRWFTTYNRA